MALRLAPNISNHSFQSTSVRTRFRQTVNDSIQCYCAAPDSARRTGVSKVRPVPDSK